MNLRCIYCQTPFTLARPEMLSAIITMNEKHQSHYDAHCPRCRRANSISRQRMELFFPNWQDAAKQLASAPPPAPKAETSASASLKTEPLPKAMKKAVSKKPTAAKAPAAKKTAAKTAEPKGKKK
jgi:phage FluMu protein Com